MFIMKKLQNTGTKEIYSDTVFEGMLHVLVSRLYIDMRTSLQEGENGKNNKSVWKKSGEKTVGKGEKPKNKTVLARFILCFD